MIFHKIQKQHQKETLSTRKKKTVLQKSKSNRSLMSHELEGNNIGNLFFLISGNRLFRKHRKRHILEELLEL